MTKQHKHRLWLITEPFYPEDEGVGYYMSHYAFGLTENFSVGAICTQPSYSHKGTKCPPREIYKDVEIFRCWATQFDRQKIVNRLINLFTMCLSMFWRMLWQVRKNDIVLVASSPPMLPFLAVIACFFKRAKCVIYIYDLYPDIAVVGHIIKKDSWLTKLMSFTTNFFYRRANMIFVLGRDMQNLVHEKLKRSDLPIEHVPIFADTDEIVPIPRNADSLLKQYHLVEKFVVQIAGNLGFLHDVDLLLEAAKRLEDVTDIHFLIFSSGKKIPFLEKTIREENRKNITLCPRLPREKTNEIVNACDLAISSLFISGMYGLASPSRTYGILAAGKPQLAITDDNTEVALLIQEENAGWQVKPHDVEGAVAAIRDAYENREQLSEMGKNARRAAELKYDKKIIIQRIKELLTSLY